MFLVLLNYKKPLSLVDLFVDEHKAFLQKQYEAGYFLLSGRKEPRTGGVILSKAESREVLEAIISNDPFFREGVADYDIIEFLPSMGAKVFEELVKI